MKRKIKNSHRACRACGKYITVNEDGLYRVHGPRNRRCTVNQQATEKKT